MRQPLVAAPRISTASSSRGPAEKGTDTPEKAQEFSAPPSGAALLAATAGGVGYAPVAPGTFGSAVGCALQPLLAAPGPWFYLLATLGLLSLGVWAADEAERGFGRADDGRIVIDEVVGQLLTFAPLVLLGIGFSWAWLVTGFVVFRCLDIWKPGPVRWAERRFSGGAGVMLDDVAAGLLGALLLGATTWFV